MEKKENLQIVSMSGSITVFLSLIFLLLCAFAAVMIEGARIHTGMQRERLILETAVDAEFTKYYLPLYEKYHVFFLNQGIDTDTLEGNEFLNSIKEYILEGMNTEGGEWELDGVNLYQSELEKLSLAEVETAVDENGEIFLNQVYSYMKYDAVENGCENIMEKLGLFDSAQKTSVVLEKKLQTDESMGKLDELIIEMMTNVDGTILKCDGTLRAAEYFVKKYAPNGISKDAQAVHHEKVFGCLKAQYLDPCQVLRGIKAKCKQLLQYLSKQEKLERKISQADTESKAGRRNVKKWEKELKEVEGNISHAEDIIRKNKKRLMAPIDEMMLCCEEGLQIIPQLEEKQKQIEQEISQYDEVLNEKKEEILPQLYEEMSNDLKEKKTYIGYGSTKEKSLIEQIKKMEEPLRKDNLLLNDFWGYRNCDFSLETDSVKEFMEQTEEYYDMISSYDTKSLEFDYSGLNISEKVDSPLESIQDFLEEGIMDLIIPDGMEVSKTEIENPDHLYNSYGAVSKGTDDEKNDAANNGDKEFGDNLKGIDANGYNSDITTSVGGFSFSEAGNDFLENLLASQYAKKHFPYWSDEEASENVEDKENQKVKYGVEYIIFAKNTDKKNLKAMMNRILFSRTIFNFMTLLTDASKKAKCYATATALVGFTGLEPLVRLTQMLIMIAWAYEESVVDTAAIFGGKSVSIFKSGNEFQIQYSDLLRISKSLVQAKVKAMPDAGSILSMDYQDFLTIFLLLTSQTKKSYRCMDLIEKDLKDFYEPSFSVEQCVFGARVEAEYVMPSKLKEEFYSYQISCSHSY